MLNIKKTLASLMLAGAIAAPTNAAIIELSLVVDDSGSINPAEFALQRDAYANIFGSGSFFDDFVNAGDTLWVNMILFSTGAAVAVDFVEIDSNADADGFAADVAALTRSGGLTNTAAATDLAVFELENNGVDGDRLVIDVSTDGQPTAGGGGGISNSQAAIDAATAAAVAGVTVNAIGVGNGIGVGFLTSYTGAGGGFFVQAADFATFQTALERKLRREITGGVPAPAALGLMLVALMGMGFRKRQS